MNGQRISIQDICIYRILTMQYMHICKKYTIEYYSAIKKKERMLSAPTWMNLEIIILSEVKMGKDKYHMISFICGI